MILDDLGIPYQIIEAQDHVGGRLFTYQFKKAINPPYDYYDVGAMRFPDTNAMRRVFRLFQSNKVDIQLQPYIFSNPQQLYSYNNFTYPKSSIPSGDAFGSAGVLKDIPDPTPYITCGVDNLVNDVIKPFAKGILADLNTGKQDGWEYMEQFDKYSTRAYMSLQYTPSPELLKQFPNLPTENLTNDVANWCETFDKATGWYDRALSETVLEEVAFGWFDPDVNPPPPPVQWHCVKGGTQEIANQMRDYLLHQKSPDVFTYNTRATSISMTGNGDMQVTALTADGGGYSKTFSHVISTIPLPVLRTLDLSQAGLNSMQSNALRELNYGPAIKIGMQFKSAWWTTAANKKGVKLNIIGGQSYTDSMLRTIVYTSFGDVEQAQTTTLIASYCWTEDAARFGALIDKDNNFLQSLVLRELATIHDLDISFLQDQLVEMHSWSWSHDPYTMGAYAFFGPGKFEDLYQSLNAYAGNGRLHFAGEALSTRHAWVEGAFDSAWKAVAELLWTGNFDPEIKIKFYTNWGTNPEWIDPTSAKNGDHSAIFDIKRSLLLQHLVAVHYEK